MEHIDIEKGTVCPSPELSAYIDGELSRHDELELEQHVSGCGICTDDLNLQKSFLNALDYSLDEKNEIDLPCDFTQAVVANAESRVSGLRRPHERRNAAFICAAADRVFALCPCQQFAKYVSCHRCDIPKGFCRRLIGRTSCLRCRARLGDYF